MATLETVSHRDALDIVFANRNRAYGAYQLRRAYPNYLGKAFALGLLFIGALLVGPHILSALTTAFPDPPLEEAVYDGKIRDIDLAPPPPPPLPEVKLIDWRPGWLLRYGAVALIAAAAGAGAMAVLK